MPAAARALRGCGAHHRRHSLRCGTRGRVPANGTEAGAASHPLLPVRLLRLQGYGELLVTRGGVNLAARTAALVEGENDPRCLLLAFACARAACAVYDLPACSDRRREFEAEAGELFEVAVEPYFPVRFTPRKGDPSAITRRQLADGVAGCMAAAPEFAPLALPLLSEKLGSALR